MKGKLLGYVFCLGSVIVNILVLVIESAVNEYNPGNIFGLMNKDQFLETFVKPYNRISAFAIGLFVGFVCENYIEKRTQPVVQKDIELDSLNSQTALLPQTKKYKKNAELMLVS